MKRISNRDHAHSSAQAPMHVYVDREVEVVVEAPAPAPQIVYVEKQVEVEAQPVQVERVIIEKQIEQVDLSGIHADISKHEEALKYAHLVNSRIAGELEMQRRAIVAIKAQRDIDRSRRLMLIRRLKKAKAAQKRHDLKLKLAIGASLILSIVSLIVKL